MLERLRAALRWSTAGGLTVGQLTADDIGHYITLVKLSGDEVTGILAGVEHKRSGHGPRTRVVLHDGGHGWYDPTFRPDHPCTIEEAS